MTKSNSFLPEKVEQALITLLNLTQTDIANGELNQDWQTHVDTVRDWLNTLSAHTQLNAQHVLIDDAVRPEGSARAAYIAGITELGRTRQRTFSNFSEADFFAGAAYVFYSLGIWNKLPAAWTLGLLYNLSPLDSPHAIDDLNQLAVKHDLHKLAHSLMQITNQIEKAEPHALKLEEERSQLIEEIAYTFLDLLASAPKSD